MEENKVKLFEHVAKEFVIDNTGYYGYDRSYVADNVLLVDTQTNKHLMKSIFVVKYRTLWTEVYSVVYNIDTGFMSINLMKDTGLRNCEKRLCRSYEDEWLKKMQEDGIDIKEGFLK